MGRYNKALVALVMAIVGLVQQVWGISLGLDEGTVTVIIGAITTVLVYLVPNKPADPNRLNSHPAVYLTAFALALVLIGGGLAGCASVNAGRDATLQERVDAARTDLTTASVFLAVYATFPICGEHVPQPCRNDAVYRALDQGRIGAVAALDAADTLIGQGAPADKILALLLIAQQAVTRLRNVEASAGG